MKSILHLIIYSILSKGEFVMKKTTDILFTIGMCLIVPTGIFGVIYELFIWNKSIIPDWLFNMVIIVGTIGILCIIPFVIYNSKRKKMD